MNFPDLPHLRQLQNDLWRWPKSRAAVMVGAGLSLNAEPLPGVNARFPTWRELARAMFNELHPFQPDEAPAQVWPREERFNSASPLRIASEYEAAFGRRKLDFLIRSQIPDSEHKPGRLHHLLLQLPWADVFTTNYDTLLERTEIPWRTYQPVTKANGLTTAFAPRIVKLHGSFPSQTPFIITEEDYRTYPHKFAPFVNSVQQTLLENSFVLVGFSGDDPNFLEWTGWIRDQLSGNHAPVYLVGPLCLEDAERLLLARRGVTPIDLSPVFAGVQPLNGVHAASIEWFLNCLFAARPSRPERWPELGQASVSASASHPPIFDAAPVVPESAGRSPNLRGLLNAEAVGKVVARWQFERQNYPGWLAATENKRSELWNETELWIQPLTKFVKDRPVVDRILLFREINWRLETSMVPFSTEWIEPFREVVDELFDTLVEGRSGPLSSEFAAKKQASDSELADAWLEIAFGLLRDAREDYDAPRWNGLKAKVDKVVQQYQQHADRNHYEAALWAMWNVDRGLARTIISSWQPSAGAPLAAMRKAGLLAELDELGEAQTILRAALRDIWSGLRSQGQNITLLSLEGWCTYLLYAVESSLDFRRRSALLDEFRERWDELKAWDCSPWTHKEYFDEALSAPPPKVHQETREVRGFDLGQVTFSTRFGTDNVRPYLPAFACIRLFEQCGIPMRLRGVNIAGDRLKNACRWIAPLVGFWSPALLIRAGKLDDFTKGDFLNRAQVAAMAPALAKRLYAWCLQILERELGSLTGLIAMGSAQESALEVLPEVLSRLAFKVGAGELRRTFPLVLYFHRQPGVRSRIRLHKSSEPWFQRLFDAADDDLLLEWLPDLIKGPLFDERVPPVILVAQAWPDPMQHFPGHRVPNLKGIRPDLVTKINESVDWLVTRAASESREGRLRAIDRLIEAHHSRLLTTDQQRQLGELLWSQRSKANLPDRPGFAVFGFLHLPAPAGVDVPSIVKNYILSLPSEGSVSGDANGRISVAIGPSEQPLIYEASLASKPIFRLRGEALGGLEWTQDEARQLYQKAREWWAKDKKAFEMAEHPFFGVLGANPVLKTLARLGQFLSRVVLPRMEWADENDWQQLLGWLQEIRGVGAYPTVALPYMLLHRPAEAKTIAETIGTDLNSEVERAVAGPAKAVRHWIHLSAIGRVPTLPSNLMMALIEKVIFRCRPGVGACVKELAYLIIERPEIMTPSQAALLTSALMPWHYATILPLQNVAPGEFDESERPNLRVLVGGLAGALKIWFEGSSPRTPEPTAITSWRSFCASDPLPEFRRAFNVWDRVVA